jgi:hypothetical protein
MTYRKPDLRPIDTTWWESDLWQVTAQVEQSPAPKLGRLQVCAAIAVHVIQTETFSGSASQLYEAKPSGQKRYPRRAQTCRNGLAASSNTRAPASKPVAYGQRRKNSLMRCASNLAIASKASLRIAWWVLTKAASPEQEGKTGKVLAAAKPAWAQLGLQLFERDLENVGSSWTGNKHLVESARAQGLDEVFNPFGELLAARILLYRIWLGIGRYIWDCQGQLFCLHAHSDISEVTETAHAAITWTNEALLQLDEAAVVFGLALRQCSLDLRTHNLLKGSFAICDVLRRSLRIGQLRDVQPLQAYCASKKYWEARTLASQPTSRPVIAGRLAHWNRPVVARLSPNNALSRQYGLLGHGRRKTKRNSQIRQMIEVALSEARRTTTVHRRQHEDVSENEPEIGREFGELESGVVSNDNAPVDELLDVAFLVAVVVAAGAEIKKLAKEGFAHEPSVLRKRVVQSFG